MDSEVEQSTCDRLDQMLRHCEDTGEAITDSSDQAEFSALVFRLPVDQQRSYFKRLAFLEMRPIFDFLSSRANDAIALEMR